MNPNDPRVPLGLAADVPPSAELDQTIAKAEREDDITTLTEEANAARARLLQTVEAIDHRAHEALSVERQVRIHFRGLVGAAVAAGALLLGGVALIAFRVATRKARRRRERWHLVERMWRHPERGARGDATTFWGKLGRSIALTLLTTAISVPLKRGMTKMLPEAEPKRRVA